MIYKIQMNYLNSYECQDLIDSIDEYCLEAKKSKKPVKVLVEIDLHGPQTYPKLRDLKIKSSKAN